MMKVHWVLAFAAMAAAGCAPEPAGSPAAELPAQPTAEQVLAQGKYIVEGIGMCGDCHTPFLPDGTPDMSKHLAGAPLGFAPVAPMPWTPVSPALAGLPEGYTEESLKVFLATGAPGDGSAPKPPMPLYRMTEADAAAAAAYLASLPKPAS